jgi:hypothetical protein
MSPFLSSRLSGRRWRVEALGGCRELAFLEDPEYQTGVLWAARAPVLILNSIIGSYRSVDGESPKFTENSQRGGVAICRGMLKCRWKLNLAAIGIS